MKERLEKMSENDVLNLLFYECKNVSELSDKELELLISEVLSFEDVPCALRELYRRSPETAFSLAKEIVEKGKGDEFLQGATMDIIFEYESEYVINFVKDNISKINYYVYACILDCFAVESKQPFSENLSHEFLEMLVNKYNEYAMEEKKKIEDKYNFFVESYKFKFIKPKKQIRSRLSLV